MRRRVADDLEPVLVLVGDDRDVRVALDAEGGVDQLAVDLAAASAARASPAPIDCAISATVTGPGKGLLEPSGRRMFTMRSFSGPGPVDVPGRNLRERFQRAARVLAPRAVQPKKNAGGPHFFPLRQAGRRDWTRTNDPYHVKVVL